MDKHTHIHTYIYWDRGNVRVDVDVDVDVDLHVYVPWATTSNGCVIMNHEMDTRTHIRTYWG